MEHSEIQKKLDSIEVRIKNIEKKKIGFWDMFQSLATILIPAAIALAGYLISNGIKKAEVDVAETNAKVAQAELVNKFMASLTSKSTFERALAVDAILIAIPGHGASIARAMAENDTSESVKLSARSSLDKRLLQLISDLFSDQATIRKIAAQELLQGWHSDALLVKHLLEFAGSHPSNINGIYNTVVILNSIDRQTLLQYRDSILEFLSQAEALGPKTKSTSQQVRDRL
ncbi:MAG: hypothetical protein OEQ53_01215 [Saprospiraceae bacterium]|nr:hypothetical protein [Saprospiraceae bacterium]